MSSLFGKSFKKDHLLLDEQIIFTNHGSYGSVPKEIFDKKLQLQIELENCPDKWFRLTSFELWNKNKKFLADYIKIEDENLLITENATEAINSILKAVNFDAEKDAILATQYTYNAVLNSIDYTSKYRLNKPINVIKVPINFPIRDVNHLLEMFEKTCLNIINEKKLNIRLAVIDHISSSTAILFPVKQIIEIIKKYSNNESLILIDGAHAIGQTEINLKELNCDFYVSNLHKWFLAPRGCSFLYIKDKNKLGNSLQPCYISYGYGKDLSYNFYQRGTSDKTSWFLVENCINFYEIKLGGLNKVSEYCTEILEKAVELITRDWKTKKLEIPKELEAPFMKMIEIPDMKNYQIDKPEDSDKICVKLMYDLFVKYKTISCIVYVQNKLYCRISCFVYNCLEDYIHLKNSVLDLKNTQE